MSESSTAHGGRRGQRRGGHSHTKENVFQSEVPSERKEPSVPREELGDSVEVSRRKDSLKQGLREEKE